MENKDPVLRGPSLRAVPSPRLFDVLRDRYRLVRSQSATDLGGSANLNLLVTAGDRRVVVRVYRPWVTSARLADIQQVRQHLLEGGVPVSELIRTRDGDGWIDVDGRVVEVERHVVSDARMDSWEQLEGGLPWLGRIHTLLQTLRVGPDGTMAPAANQVESRDALAGTLLGTRRMREWDASPSELRLADAAEELARLVDLAERDIVGHLPRQLVHGDFWDNNVFFRSGRVVHIADFDFLAERARVDDLALTLYYTNSTFWDDPLSDGQIGRLSRLVDAYESRLDSPLTSLERAALPLALARTPLGFVGMIASVDSEREARRLAAEMIWDVAWALAIMRNIEHWQTVFTANSLSE